MTCTRRSSQVIATVTISNEVNIFQRVTSHQWNKLQRWELYEWSFVDPEVYSLVMLAFRYTLKE